MIAKAPRPVRVGVVEQGFGKTPHYVVGVGVAGGVVSVLDWRERRDARVDAHTFDAFVLCGGDDPPGWYFGQEDHPAITLDDPRRDEYEIELCKWIGHLRLPTVAVCRGMQMLNIAMGGDIDQHLPDVPGRSDHTGGVTHALRLAEGSWLARLAGGADARPQVNSYHHQAVCRVAPGLRATAWSEDGAIEAVEAEDGFIIGVQWHPERDGADAPCDATLFEALVRHVRESWEEPVGIPGR